MEFIIASTRLAALNQFVIGRKAMTNLDSVLKKQRHHFANKGLYS